MKIKKIDWLSEEGREAEVTIGDDENEIVCFAHPIRLSIGIEVVSPLFAIDSRNIQRSPENDFKIERQGENFSYCITGIVMDLKESIISIKKILIKLDMPIPQDIAEKEYVSFCCERIDFLS